MNISGTEYRKRPCIVLPGQKRAIKENSEMKWNAVKIGEHTLNIPVIQGGMGIGVSRCRLAGAVAKEGGMGVISAAQIGYDDPDFRKDPEAAYISAHSALISPAHGNFQKETV